MLATKTSSENIAITKIDFHQAKITHQSDINKIYNSNSSRKIKYTNRTGIDLRLQSFKQNLYVLLFQIIGSAILCATAELNRHRFKIEEKRVPKFLNYICDNETLNTFHVTFQNIALFPSGKITWGFSSKG